MGSEAVKVGLVAEEAAAEEAGAAMVAARAAERVGRRAGPREAGVREEKEVVLLAALRGSETMGAALRVAAVDRAEVVEAARAEAARVVALGEALEGVAWVAEEGRRGDWEMAVAMAVGPTAVFAVVAGSEAAVAVVAAAVAEATAVAAAAASRARVRSR